MTEDQASLTTMGALLTGIASSAKPGFDERSKFIQALDTAHTALRMVDASDTTEPQTDATLTAISDAVEEVERLARELGHKLPEFRRSGWK